MLPPTDTEKVSIVNDVLGSDLPTASFTSYFKHYCNVICHPSTGVATVGIFNPALRSHAEVTRAFKTLCSNPNFTRAEFESIAFQAIDILPQEREAAAHAIVNSAFMIDTASTHSPTSFLSCCSILGTRWELQQKFADFVRLSTGIEVNQRSYRKQDSYQHRAIRAWKLRKRYNINILSTDNILEHLELDLPRRSLKIFHQVAFLRAHLRRSRGCSLDQSLEDSLRMGVLPPRIALETLVTLHSILFPIVTGEKRSRSLLKKLVKHQDFDKDVLWFEYVRELPPDFQFFIWAERLEKLHKLVEQPPPDNSIVAWFERHTSERNALTVAVLGLLLSVLFGFLSFITGLLQLILAWYAWKYPVNSNSED